MTPRFKARMQYFLADCLNFEEVLAFRKGAK